MKFENLQKPEFAVPYLADRLIDGTLVLFLGAGASSGFGLPNWNSFVRGFLHETGLDPVLDDHSSADEKERALDKALRTIGHSHERKVEIVKRLLYPDPETLNQRLAFSQELLIAIASLLIGRKRGHVSRVVSFNYDSMLEWFLGVFGLLTRTIYNTPSLEGSEDVRIYHPQGYVPHPKMEQEDSNFLIVGSLDANERAGNEKDPWWHKVRDLLESSLGLYVGLSFDTFQDRAFQPHLRQVSKDLLRHQNRPLGIWIFLEEHRRLSDDEKAECLDYMIVPVCLPTKESVTEFLLGISQAALVKLKEVC